MVGERMERLRWRIDDVTGVRVTLVTSSFLFNGNRVFLWKVSNLDEPCEMKKGNSQFSFF
jgi:hypothetical protein